jgi:hypothetical protein
MSAEQGAAPPALWGVDFSSAPSRTKPIMRARGQWQGDGLRLLGVDSFAAFPAFEAALAVPGPWVAAFDFPFGLPRAFVQAQGLGATLAEVAAHVRARHLTRLAWRAAIDAFGNARPPGQRLLHRACDTAHAVVRSTSPLQTRYVPVGFMFYEGLPRLLAAGLHLPGLHPGDVQRVALEAYPGLLAWELIGRRSYKNGDSTEHRAARREMVRALAAGGTRLAIPLGLTRAQRQALHADVSGDELDAVLALVQAAWASRQPGHGLPAAMDPLEGWICTL